MKKFTEMKVGDDAQFYALVESFQKRYTPNKSAYYGMTLSDGETSVDARVWDVALIEKINVTAGSVYLLDAHINEYAGKTQYVITQIKEVAEEDIDVKQFYRTAPLSEEELRQKIKGYIRKIDNEILKKLVVELINKVSDKYFKFPAAMSMHHNYLSGLAYHTYSMLCMADRYLEVYPGMNAGLLYAGVLLHDIGKTKELSSMQSPVYTQEGNLLGHIVIGLQMIAVVASELGIAETEEVQMLEHLVATHHGELEYGSPKEPGTMEAFALHFIDLADSKMGAFSPEVERTAKGSNTGPIASINRRTLYVPDLK